MLHLAVQAGVSWVRYSPDGRHLDLYGADRHIRRWSTSTWEPTASIHYPDTESRLMAVLPDGDTLLVGRFDRPLNRLHIPTGHLAPLAFSMHGFVGAVAIVPSKSHCLTTAYPEHADPCILRWTLERFTPPRELWSHTSRITHIAVSSDDRLLASIDRDGRIRIGPLDLSKVPLDVECPFTVGRLVFAQVGRYLVAGANGRLVVFDHEREYRYKLHSLDDFDYRSDLVIHPDDETLAYGTPDGNVAFWRVGDAQSHATHTLFGGAIDALAFAPDGSTLAVGNSAGVIVLDLE